MPCESTNDKPEVSDMIWPVVKFNRKRVLQPVSGIPPPGIAVPPSKVVAPPIFLQLIAKWLRLGGPHCISGQLIFGKVVTIVATRGQILRLKCTNFFFGRYLDGGVYSAPPGILAKFMGPASRRREGRKGKEGTRRNRNGWGGVKERGRGEVGKKPATFE